MSDEVPETRYARSGDASVAYQVVGDGPIDVVFVEGFVSHVELAWEVPSFSNIFSRLASFSRLILFDKRGTGLSERIGHVPTLEERMDDVRAVMDAAGSDRAALVGISEGGPMALTFAATYPERTSALVLWATFARTFAAPDYPIGIPPAKAERTYDRILENWGRGQSFRAISFQDLPDDPELLKLLGRYERNAATPSGAVAALRFGGSVDVRHALPAISCPTLVVHRTGDPLVPVAQGRYLAEHIARARMVELPGEFHLSGRGADAAVLDAVEEFLSGTRSLPNVERALKTVLFTDIVGSTQRAAAVGDRNWLTLLDSYRALSQREIERARGRLVETTGDGFLAVFDGPARAVRCAQTIRAHARGLGLEIRAGLHTGECELRGEEIAGIALHIAARVQALASPGEILVTGTVRDLAIGSGVGFVDRGVHELKGVPGSWQILAPDGG